MDGEIRRTPGEDVKIGEEEYTCCEVCGKDASSWRYKDASFNDKDGRPRPEIVNTETAMLDKDGNVVSIVRGSYTKYPEEPTEGYYNCHPQAKSKVVMRDVTRWQRSRTEVKCCGEWLTCGNFTNTCHNCGADYDISGQQLAPREQWGEETGEHWSECMEGSLDGD